MKKTILQFFIIILVLQSYGLKIQAQLASDVLLNAADSQMLDPNQFNQSHLLSAEKIELLFNQGQITEQEYNNYIDVIESGGDVLNPINPAFMTDVLVDNTEVNLDDAISNDSLKNISTSGSIKELQEYSDKKVSGLGKWSFHFIFIDRKGKKIELTSRLLHTPIRPASTLKLFTANMAYDEKSYNLAQMDTMLRWSVNHAADSVLRSVAKLPKYARYNEKKESYLLSPQVLNHKMRDYKHGYRTLDKVLLKGAGIMSKYYSHLEDSIKFHPLNGSGLQDEHRDENVHLNLVTTRFETALLENIYSKRSKYEKFKLMLPSPGATGTLRARFNESRKYAKIYAKTGTLSGQKALAGFAEIYQKKEIGKVKTISPGTVIFSIIGDGLTKISTDQAMQGPIESIVSMHIRYIQEKLSK